jgi:hypothetical protein
VEVRRGCGGKCDTLVYLEVICNLCQSEVGVGGGMGSYPEEFL